MLRRQKRKEYIKGVRSDSTHPVEKKKKDFADVIHTSIFLPPSPSAKKYHCISPTQWNSWKKNNKDKALRLVLPCLPRWRKIHVTTSHLFIHVSTRPDPMCPASAKELPKLWISPKVWYKSRWSQLSALNMTINDLFRWHGFWHKILQIMYSVGCYRAAETGIAAAYKH